MLAHGSWLGAMAVLALAKVVSMGVTAFIFDVTRPKLLQLAWFRWLYEHMLVWLARAHALVDPIKARIKHAVRRCALAAEARPPEPLLPLHRAHPPRACRRSRRSSCSSVRRRREQRLEPVQHVVQHVRRRTARRR